VVADEVAVGLLCPLWSGTDVVADLDFTNDRDAGCLARNAELLVAIPGPNGPDYAGADPRKL